MDIIRKLLGDKLIDTHCHINDTGYDSERSTAIADAKQHRVERIIDIAVDLPSSARTLALSQEYPELIPAIGIDPECLIVGSALYSQIDDFPAWLAQQRQSLLEIITKAEVIGECGVDTYWLYRNFRDGKISKMEMDASIAKQEQLFRMHCELAAKFHKPLSVHSRGAEKRCLEIVSDYDVSAIFHSFTGSYKVASQIVQCGHYLGVNGIVTYDSADDLRNLYKRLMGKLVDPQPADFYDRQIVFETDSPFLFPFDSRKRNYPSQVSVVYNYLAQIITNYGHQ